MKKSLFIFSVLFLLTGVGCAFKYPKKSVTLQKSAVDVKSAVLANEFQSSSYDTSTTFAGAAIVNPYAVSSSKIFSDPEADVTFVIPSTWHVEKGSLRANNGAYFNLDEQSWVFTYEGRRVMDFSINPIEAARDGCDDIFDRGVPPEFFQSINIYPTSDSKTSVYKQICSDWATISWVAGQRPNVVSDPPPVVPPNKHGNIYSVLFYSVNEINGQPSNLRPRADFVYWVNNIAQSVTFVPLKKTFKQSPFTVSSYSIFATDDTVFTFQYPSAWMYSVSDFTNGAHPSAPAWRFTNRGDPIMDVMTPAHETSLSEDSFDRCALTDPTMRQHLVEVKSFPTNDPRTNVIAETCAPCVDDNAFFGVAPMKVSCPASETREISYIYWMTNKQLSATSTLQAFSSTELAGKINLIMLGPFSDHWKRGMALPSRKQYLDLVHHIASSIKIKK